MNVVPERTNLGGAERAPTAAPIPAPPSPLPQASSLTQSRPLRVLLLATLFNFPYRALRCAHAAGAEMYVLGNAGALGLRFSRQCRRFFLSESIINGDRHEGVALEINCLVRDLGIGMVMAGDAPSTRTLIASRDLIEAPCFPMPSLEVFDFLNDKWSFAQLCTKLEIRQPRTRLFANAAALELALANGEVDCPLVAKPLGRSGESGVVVVDCVDNQKRLRTINYRPVLVQEFIPGCDIGASIYAQEGRIAAFVAHRFWHQTYSILEIDSIFCDLEKIARHFKLDGVYNFDMRLAPDGSVYYLECNPRFFFKISLSMLAGINFIELGLPPARRVDTDLIVAAGPVRMPKALLYSLLTSGRCSRRDWAAAHFLYSDPVPYMMERLGLTV